MQSLHGATAVITCFADEALSSASLQTVTTWVNQHPGAVVCAPSQQQLCPPGTLPVMALETLDAAAALRVLALRDALSPATLPLVVLARDVCGIRAVQQLLVHGVADVVFDPALDTALNDLLARAERAHRIEAVLRSPVVAGNLGGRSPVWMAFLAEVVQAALYLQSPFLLEGETGTGKELIARLFHTLDTRPHKGDLVVVDCTTLREELAGSELFGHERGAYTGAHAARSGAAAMADGGTLFLDEVGELHPTVQAQLLRLLQEGMYKAVGGERWHKASFRLVCATHRNLWQAVQEGKFRADLFFRIAGCRAQVPALRDRVGDAVILAQQFLQEFGCPQGCDGLVRQFIAAYDFPGNVRELRQLMLQAAMRHCGQLALTVGDLPPVWRNSVMASFTADSLPPTSCAPTPPCAEQVASSSHVALTREWLDSGFGLRDIVQRAGDMAIQVALDMESNQVGRAAKRLGVTERAIQLRRAQRLTAGRVA